MSLRTMLANVIDSTIKVRRPGSRSIYQVARRIVQAYENNDVNMRSNGEHWFQSRLAERGKVIAIDVGANEGEWVLGLLDCAKDCEVYCFEPVPQTFAKLTENVKDPRAQLFNLALSSEVGNLQIYSAIENSYLSSVHDVALLSPDAKTEVVDVPASTGDKQIADLKLSNVTVLKIDAEGHDFDVLEGFKNATSQDKIEFIQFEYNAYTLVAGRSLRDFFDALRENYLICRLLPAGLEACGYHVVLDDFRQTNWVAICKDRIDKAVVQHFNIRPADGLAGDALREGLSDNSFLSDALQL